MSTVLQSGTQATTPGTEHTVTTTVNAAGTYLFVVDSSALAAGETLELRYKRKALSSGAVLSAPAKSFHGVQGGPLLVSIPIAVPANVALDCTIKQIGGSSRNIPWCLEQA